MTVSASLGRRLARAAAIVRYHRPSQLLGRAVSRTRRLWRRWAGIAVDDIDDGDLAQPRIDAVPGFEAILASRLAEREDDTLTQRVDDLRQRRFRFLNEKRTFPDGIDWRCQSVEPVAHLWRFQLHYHEFLLDYAAAAQRDDRPELIDEAWRIVADWIDANPQDDPHGRDDAWHPFCLSRRLPVWLMLWTAQPPAVGPVFEAVLRSIEQQARDLNRNLEWDLRGNHLLENLRALVLEASCFNGANQDRRLSRAMRLVRFQLSEQVLPHGEHFERSPFYHQHMLEAVLDLRDATAAIRPQFSAECQEVGDRMARFLEAIVHPDGGIPLLGDSVLSGAPAPANLIERTRRASGVSPMTNDGSSTDCETMNRPQTIGPYWIVRRDDDFLIFDTGPVGADQLPAHAHSDLLTFEASIGGRRLFVDRGCYDYGDGAMRQLCRSTAAHNVLQVDGGELCDVYGKFRMGRRARVISAEASQQEDAHRCIAMTDAWRHRRITTHRRTMEVRADGAWTCEDFVDGRGRHELVSRLHLHPDVVIESTDERSVMLLVGSLRVRLKVIGTDGVRLSTEADWYCPHFGQKLASTTIVIRWTGALPAHIGWVLERSSWG